MTEVSSEWKIKYNRCSEKVVNTLDIFEEEGQEKAESYFKKEIENINYTQSILAQNLKERCHSLIKENKIMGVLGGDHSVALGSIQAINDEYDDFEYSKSMRMLTLKRIILDLNNLEIASCEMY